MQCRQAFRHAFHFKPSDPGETEGSNSLKMINQPGADNFQLSGM